MTSDRLAALRELFADWEHEVTGISKHWENTPERQVIDNKYFNALADLVQELGTEAIGQPEAHDDIVISNKALLCKSPDVVLNIAKERCNQLRFEQLDRLRVLTDGLRGES